MTVYNYHGFDKNGQSVKGKVEADDLRSARQSVRQLGFTPTKVYADASANAAKVDPANSFAIKSLTLKERTDFTSTFCTLHKAGLPVIESLIFIEQDANSRRIRMLAREIRQRIMAGSTFSDTIAKYSNIFGLVYVGLIKAGEESGEMERTLERLLELLKKEGNIRGKITAAMAYPVFVVILAHVVVLIMLLFVFPAFKKMFDDMGAPLPWVTQFCINAGEFLKARWYVIPIGLTTIVWSIVSLLRWPVSRKKIDAMVIKVPLIGDLLKYSAFSNFLSVLQVAYEAGIAIVDCLYLANITFSNAVMNKAVANAIKKVQSGVNLSEALRATKVFPGMVLFMISTGEQSGRLGELMDQCVKYIDGELDRVIDTMTKMIEPTLLVFIGGLVCFLAASLYLPLFQSYQLIN